MSRTHEAFKTIICSVIRHFIIINLNKTSFETIFFVIRAAFRMLLREFKKILLLNLHSGILLKSIFKRFSLTETDFQVFGINRVSIAKEVDCKNNKISKVEPDVINLSALNINAKEMGPMEVISEEFNLKEPGEYKLTFRDFFTGITFIIRHWEFHRVVNACHICQRKNILNGKCKAECITHV